MAKAKGTVASQMVTAGSYEYVVGTAGPYDLTSNANQVTDFTATGETLLAWTRCKWIGMMTGSFWRPVSMACVKQESGEGAPDLTDSDVVEKLRRDGKLFFLKHGVWIGANYGGVYQKLEFQTEFRNVKLRDGEMLRWYIWNHGSATSGNVVTDFFVHEYRKVTV